MKVRFTLPLLFALCRSALGSEPAQQDFTISSAMPGKLEIQYQQKRILLYAFATNQFKPYVKELYTLTGQNVLLDAPADHLHHHGLMFAIRVNGINFWEEVGDPGRQRSMRILLNKSDPNQASFAEVVEWTATASNIPLLYETRTISISVNSAAKEVALDWQSNFQVGAMPVKLTGSAYNGLGLRLPESFNHVAHHRNSAGLPYTPEAKWDVTPADWSAVAGNLNGTEATVALFAVPSTKGDTRFFTMLNPFAYLSVTQNLDKQPLDYGPGDKFSVRYLLTIYPESKSSEFLNRRHRAWIGDCK